MKNLMKIRKLGMLFLIISLPVLVSMYGCGGGGGGSDSGTPTPTPGYVGFTNADFAEKTIYLVDTAGYSKAIFYSSGNLRAYTPNQIDWYSNGIWSINAGKLEVARVENPDYKTVYTLTADDTTERYFSVSRLNSDGTAEAVGMFYDQSTGYAQAQAWVASHNSKTQFSGVFGEPIIENK